MFKLFGYVIAKQSEIDSLKDTPEEKTKWFLEWAQRYRCAQIKYNYSRIDDHSKKRIEFINKQNYENAHIEQIEINRYQSRIDLCNKGLEFLREMAKTLTEEL